jgi:hypothetical protein
MKRITKFARPEVPSHREDLFLRHVKTLSHQPTDRSSSTVPTLTSLTYSHRLVRLHTWLSRLAVKSSLSSLPSHLLHLRSLAGDLPFLQKKGSSTFFSVPPHRNPSFSEGGDISLHHPTSLVTQTIRECKERLDHI